MPTGSPRQVVTQQRLKPDGTYVTTTVDYDALGRTVQRSVSGGPKKAWQYDALGRVWKESNPTYGSFVWTEFFYDALERVTQVVYPDGSAEKRCYTNNATLAVDAAGKFTKVTKDGLGRVSSVMEDANGSCLGSTNAAGQNLETNYTYTGSDQLWTVNQGGQTRTFEYDSLGRLKNASNPESGAVAYTLEAAGNVVGKAACGRTATMKYDRLNRILKKT